MAKMLPNEGRNSRFYGLSVFQDDELKDFAEICEDWGWSAPELSPLTCASDSPGMMFGRECAGLERGWIICVVYHVIPFTFVSIVVAYRVIIIIVGVADFVAERKPPRIWTTEWEEERNKAREPAWGMTILKVTPRHTRATGQVYKQRIFTRRILKQVWRLWTVTTYGHLNWYPN